MNQGDALYILLVNPIPDDNRAEDVSTEGVFSSFQNAIEAAFAWAIKEGYEPDGNMLELSSGIWFYLETEETSEGGGGRVAFVIEDFLLDISTSQLEEAVRMPTVGTA